MGAVFDHRKGYAEDLIIAAVSQRWDQARTAARTIAQRSWAQAGED